MKRVFSLIVSCSFSSTASAVYNDNYGGTIASLMTYAESDSIYIYLTNQPTSNPPCNPTYFVIDASVPLERKKVMYARLLLARATGEAINIGYDNASNCADGFLRIHRVG